MRVSHRDTVADMVRKCRDLEKVVLSRGTLALGKRILVYQNKTVVFLRARVVARVLASSPPRCPRGVRRAARITGILLFG